MRIRSTVSMVAPMGMGMDMITAAMTTAPATAMVVAMPLLLLWVVSMRESTVTRSTSIRRRSITSVRAVAAAVAAPRAATRQARE